MSNYVIRRVKNEDIVQLVEIYKPYVENTTVSFEFIPPTVQEFEQRVNTYSRDYPYLVAELDGEVIGFAYGSRLAERAGFNWSAQLSIYLAPRAKGLGIGREMYNIIMQIMEQQGIYAVYAIISTPNPDSIAFHSKMGFVECARLPRCGYKNNVWCDIVYMYKLLRECTGTPQTITTFCELDTDII